MLMVTEKVVMKATNGLDPLFIVRAFASNDIGTAYGNELTFTTLEQPTVPVVSTAPVTDITQTTAVSGGNVTSEGGDLVFAKGVCWNTSPNPTVSGPHTMDGGGLGSYESDLTGLAPATLYYVRAYATNNIGTAYGEELTFTTLDVTLPTVITATVTNITQTTATSGGNVTSDGGDFVSARGVCWDLSPNPTITDHTTDGSGTGQKGLTGLTLDTLYYIRICHNNPALLITKHLA
jgi:hypothetical protein